MTETQLIPLFQIEPAVEAAIVAALASRSIVSISARSDDNCKLPRCAVFAELGEATGHLKAISQTEYYEDSWKISGSISITTQRKKSKGPHSQLVARIRVMLQQALGALNTMPYHAFSRISTDGSSYEIDEDEDSDTTTVAFVGEICILPSAWIALGV